MKVKRKGYGVLLTVLCCVAALCFTFSVLTAYLSSTINIELSNGRSESVFVRDMDRGHTAYEDSKLFFMIFDDVMDDIVRMCVIRNQMETDGAFDADKPVDIVKYAGRNKKTVRGIAEDTDAISVVYKLDDLIKWGNYEYDIVPVTGTKAQIEAYFYSLTEGANIVSGVTEEDVLHVSPDNMLYEFFPDESIIYEDGLEYTAYLLVDRYKTIEGNRLTDYVRNRSEYNKLVRELVLSTSDLAHNYDEYVRYDGAYQSDNSNVIYCCQLRDADGNLVKYSNLSGAVTAMSNDELTKLMTEQAKYAVFDPDKLQTTTNIEDVNSIVMRDSIDAYEYAFGEGSRVWIAVDGNYKADDVFEEAKEKYNETEEWFIPACIMGVVAIIMYVIFFIIMTATAGKVAVTDEDGNKHKEIRAMKADHMPIELLFALGCIVIGLFCGLMETIYYENEHILRGDAGKELLYGIWLTVAVVVNAICLPLYLIFVRKIKCKLMWNGSICKRIFDKIKNSIIDLYDNGRVVVRTWLPYLLFLAVNLVLVLLGAGGIFIAFVMDMAVGYILYKEARTRNDIVGGIVRISEGDLSHKVDTEKMHGDNLALADAVNSIGDGINKAVNTSMRDEKMKTELITNVSHDIKTPLTSIINYVDLLKRENIKDEKIRGYVDILDQKSQRLKQLTDDLVEASKITSGNIALNIEKINFVELINQSVGEFSEKFEEKRLATMIELPQEPVYIMADSRAIYRVVENLYNNIYKYALEGTRVYVNMVKEGEKVALSIKNISADPLGINVADLTERFMRGDSSRKTEGSGLGLSIAKSLTEAMKGSFDISLDGDLFKVIIGFNTI